jgi:hypothetical protein
MTKKPTPADINARNAEFWEKQSRAFEEGIAKRPHDLKHVVDKTHERIEDGAFKKVRSLESQMVELGALRDADQSVRASGTRKRARNHRQIVIEAMRAARTNQQELPDFLDAANNGSIPGIEIKPLGPRGGGKYCVTCDELSNDAKFAKSTIDGWWTAADSK